MSTFARFSSSPAACSVSRWPPMPRPHRKSRFSLQCPAWSNMISRSWIGRSLPTFILNQNEGRFDRLDLASTHYRWDGEGWIGTDYDKFWIKTEGTVKGGKVEDGQHEFLYSRAITTYFDLQAGLRSDLDSRRTRNWAAFGIEGLAPYFFDVELAGYVSTGRPPRGTDRSLLRSSDHQPADPAAADRAQFLQPIGSRARHRRRSLPKSIPACACATRSPGNSRPISASAMTANSGKRPASRGRKATRFTMCAVLAGIRLWF